MLSLCLSAPLSLCLLLCLFLSNTLSPYLVIYFGSCPVPVSVSHPRSLLSLSPVAPFLSRARDNAKSRNRDFLRALESRRPAHFSTVRASKNIGPRFSRPTSWPGSRTPRLTCEAHLSKSVVLPFKFACEKPSNHSSSKRAPGPRHPPLQLNNTHRSHQPWDPNQPVDPAPHAREKIASFRASSALGLLPASSVSSRSTRPAMPAITPVIPAAPSPPPPPPTTPSPTPL